MTKDQINLEAFFGAMLEDFKAGSITKEQAIGGLVAFSVRLNEGDFDGARLWAEQGRKLTRDLVPLDQATLLLSRPGSTSLH